MTPLISFVGSLKERVLEGSTSNFQHHQIWGSKVGHDWAIDLQCQVAPWGYQATRRGKKQAKWEASCREINIFSRPGGYFSLDKICCRLFAMYDHF